MKTTTEYTTEEAISYETIARKFSEEADSLISDCTIKKVLADEKIRFNNAAILQIPTSKLVGHNTLRHCKDLLRQKQPCPFIYSVLCFLTETSILLLIYGTIMGIYGKITTEKGGFFAPFSYLYILILSAGIAGYHALSQKQLSKILSIPFTQKIPSEKEKNERLKYLKRKRLSSLLTVILITALGTGFVYFFNLNQKYTAGLPIWFFAYAGCMVLFGIHNVIYSSHFIAFFTVGILLATRRQMEDLISATEHYLNLNRRQLLSVSHKTLQDCERNSELMDKLDASIHARMTTGRIYYILAIFILLVLDITCIVKMRTLAAPALLLFFAISVILTVLFSVAFLAANHILKATKK